MSEEVEALSDLTLLPLRELIECRRAHADEPLELVL